MTVSPPALSGKPERIDRSARLADVKTQFDIRRHVIDLSGLWERPMGSECHLWTGSIDKDGYGRFSRFLGGHRAAYMLYVGPIPEGYQIDHTCHTNDPYCSGGKSCMHRRCINPAHLEAVTALENTRRGQSPPTKNASKTHCSNGHAFDDANTYILRGWRYCRKCNAETVAKRRSRLKAEREAVA